MQTELDRREDVAAVAAVAAGAAPHPEAMFATAALKIGNVSLIVSARTTPASLICAGLAAVGVLIGVSAIVRALRSRA